MADIVKQSANPLSKLKGILANETMKQNFQNVLKENAGAFTASIIDLFQTDSSLQQCDPGKVVIEAMRAATLKLPLNKQLGFAYIVPFKNHGVYEPTFMLGYRGMIQLAQRSGQYRYINAGPVYDGENVDNDRITGMVRINGEKKSDKVIGYFAYFQLLNGFEKCVYMKTEEVTAHARKYSKSYNRPSSPWHTEFDGMAVKTVLRRILSKYGPMSIELANAVALDEKADDDTSLDEEIDLKANQQPITLPTDPAEQTVSESKVAPPEDLADEGIPEEAGF